MYLCLINVSYENEKNEEKKMKKKNWEKIQAVPLRPV